MTSNSNRLTKALVWATLAVIIIVSAIVFFGNREDETSKDIQFESHPNTSGQPLLGDKNAPVSIVEFGDYKCPACKVWDETIFPQLKAEYIDSNKVNYAYINTLFHGEESALAALASESVWNEHPDSFWAFHKEIFNQQPASQNHDDAWVTPEKLIDIAIAADEEIELEQLANDMINQTYADNVIADQELVEEYDITLTPSIIINGTMLDDPFDYEHIKEVIEEALEEE